MARRKHVHAWHYELDGSKLGPLAEDELITLIAAGTVNSNTAVWRQGMTEWEAARSTELGNHFNTDGAATDETVTQVSTKAKASSRPVKTGATRSVSGFQKWLQISLVFYAFGALMTALNSARTLFFYQQIQSGEFQNDQAALTQTANSIDTTAYFIIAFTLACFLSSAIAYGRFFHRAVVNLKAMHSRIMTISPAETWAWFIVPVASLWKPFNAFSEVRDGSYYAAGEVQPNRNLTAIWWGAWLVGNILGNVTNFMVSDGNDIDVLKIGIILSILSSIALIVAALCLLKLIGRIASAHEAARRSGNMSVFD